MKWQLMSETIVVAPEPEPAGETPAEQAAEDAQAGAAESKAEAAEDKAEVAEDRAEHAEDLAEVAEEHAEHAEETAEVADEKAEAAEEIATVALTEIGEIRAKLDQILLNTTPPEPSEEPETVTVSRSDNEHTEHAETSGTTTAGVRRRKRGHKFGR